MASVCFYFQVHQPFRLRRDFDFFAIGTDMPHEDEAKNREILKKVAERCYLPANALILDLIKQHKKAFRIAYSISGAALDQMELYAPEVIASFKALADTGCVEFLAETYYHSLAFLYSEDEFRRQVRMHKQKIRELFGVTPKTFRNTELIYNNRLGQIAEELGFQAVLAEGADRILDWRSPNFVYRPEGASHIALLLKNYRLSDDVAFRFSSREWPEWPLTADKYAGWLHNAAAQGDVVNLFMDYETFGEHQWEASGIFDFLAHLPAAVLSRPGFDFKTPSEVAKAYAPAAELDVPGLVSWADTERDVSAWLGNHMQDASAASVFALEKDVVATRDEELIHLWRKMTTSDHFYYMCTKFFQDGDIHKYFSPYDSPYDAFIAYANALNQLKWLISNARDRQREARRLARTTRTRRPTKSTTVPRQLPSPAMMSNDLVKTPASVIASGH